MIKTTAMLLDELGDYANPHTKISRMVEKGELFPIVKGLYETDRHVPPHLLAGSIYGPSYISFDYALSHYGMIPEAVYTITSATFEKKKKKRYTTLFGTFTYRDVPPKAFPLDIRLVQEGDYFYRIASPEKALCDKLYTIAPVANLREMQVLLFEDLRIDDEALENLDRDLIVAFGEKYHSTNVKKLAAFLRRL